MPHRLTGVVAALVIAALVVGYQWQQLHGAEAHGGEWRRDQWQPEEDNDNRAAGLMRSQGGVGGVLGEMEGSRAVEDVTSEWLFARAASSQFVTYSRRGAPRCGHDVWRTSHVIKLCHTSVESKTRCERALSPVSLISSLKRPES